MGVAPSRSEVMDVELESNTALADDFAAVICADEEWLRAEFDAIIEASWAEPPERPVRKLGGFSAPFPRHRGDPAPRLVRRPRCPGSGGWARQRSPPFQR